MARKKPPTGTTRTEKKRLPATRVSTRGRARKTGAGKGAVSRPPRSSRTRSSPKLATSRAGVTVTEVEELDALRRELERTVAASPPRWNADPDDVQRSVAQLVLTLIEFIRKLLERQAIRRMDAGTLTDQQVEDVGRALMNLEEAVRDMAARFGIGPDELNLDLGPIGKLM